MLILLKLLEPQYVLTSQHYLSETARLKLYNKVWDHQRGLLSNVTAIAFIICSMSLLCFTAQWIDSNFDLKCVILLCHQFCESHTAEHIKQAIKEIWENRQATGPCYFAGKYKKYGKSNRWYILEQKRPMQCLCSWPQPFSYSDSKPADTTGCWKD